MSARKRQDDSTIIVNRPLMDLSNITVVSPVECWKAWVLDIARDPEMDLERAMVHLQKHVGMHIPSIEKGEAIDFDRLQEWMAGCYNLLAIIGAMAGIDPKHEMGLDLLLRKWQSNKSDHTPPPKQLISKYRDAFRQFAGS